MLLCLVFSAPVIIILRRLRWKLDDHESAHMKHHDEVNLVGEEEEEEEDDSDEDADEEEAGAVLNGELEHHKPGNPPDKGTEDAPPRLPPTPLDAEPEAARPSVAAASPRVSSTPTWDHWQAIGKDLVGAASRADAAPTRVRPQ